MKMQHVPISNFPLFSIDILKMLEHSTGLFQEIDFEKAVFVRKV